VSVHPEKQDYIEDMRNIFKVIGGIGKLDEE